MKNRFLFLIVAFCLSAVSSVHAQAINEHQIAEILEEANDAEIDAAQLAKSKAHSKEVKNFAAHMIEEHKKNNKETKNVIKKVNIKPEDSAAADQLKEDAKSKMSLLKKQKDSAFDKLYMEQQVAMHTQLLQDLDTKFIPAAQKEEFKAHLQKTREHVSQHLEQAKSIEATL